MSDDEQKRRMYGMAELCKVTGLKRRDMQHVLAAIGALAERAVRERTGLVLPGLGRLTVRRQPAREEGQPDRYRARFAVAKPVREAAASPITLFSKE